MNKTKIEYLQTLGATKQNLECIEEMDPTDGEYAVWCLQLLNSGFQELRKFDKLAMVRNCLLEFNLLKNSPKMKEKGLSTDIMTYDLEQLLALMEKRQELKSNKQRDRDLDGAELVYCRDDWKVYRVFTPEAAGNLAKGSGWCTTRKETAANYLRKNQLWIFHLGDMPYLQAHMTEGDLTILYRNNNNVAFGLYNKVAIYDVEVYEIIKELSSTFADMDEIAISLIPVVVHMDLLGEREISDYGLEELFVGTQVRIPRLEPKAFKTNNIFRYLYRFGCEEMIPMALEGKSCNAFTLAMRLGHRVPELENLIAYGDHYISMVREGLKKASVLNRDEEVEDVEVARPAPELDGPCREAKGTSRLNPFLGDPDLMEEGSDEECCCKEISRDYTDNWVKYLDRYMDMAHYEFRDFEEARAWYNESKNLVYNPRVVFLFLQNLEYFGSVKTYLNKVKHSDPLFDKLLELVKVETGSEVKPKREAKETTYAEMANAVWTDSTRTGRFKSRGASMLASGGCVTGQRYS